MSSKRTRINAERGGCFPLGSFLIEKETPSKAMHERYLDSTDNNMKYITRTNHKFPKSN